MHYLSMSTATVPAVKIHLQIIQWTAITLTVIALNACSKAEAPTPTPVPMVTLPKVPSEVKTPTENPVTVPREKTDKDGLAKKPFKSMSRDEEAKAMPLPGQANDHSTPQIPSKPITPAPSLQKEPK
jgi:hypothetical protein